MAKIYLAGPMSGYPEFNFPAFDSAAARLRGFDHEVISPAELDREDGFDERGCLGDEPLTDETKQEFARRDLTALLEVDTIVMLPGWEKSTGARNELAVAVWLGLMVDEWIIDKWGVEMAYRQPMSKGKLAAYGSFSGAQQPAADDSKQFVIDEQFAELAALRRHITEQTAYDPKNVLAAIAYLGNNVQDLTETELFTITDSSGRETRRREGNAKYLAEQNKPSFLNTRQEVLQTAEMLVNGDRNRQYGDPQSDFRRTATFWNAYIAGAAERELKDLFGSPADPGDYESIVKQVGILNPEDVAAMMCLLKLSRITHSPEKLDSWVDLAGYAACGADCAVEA